LGIIDTLTAGFSTITKKLWLIVPPVLLDLYLWKGPQLSAVPIVRQVVGFLHDLPPMSLNGVPPSVLVQALEDVGRKLNLFSLLQNGLMGVPSLMSWVVSEPQGSQVGKVIELQSWGSLFLFCTVLLLLGVLLGSVYVALIALAIRQARSTLGVVLARVLHCWTWVTIWGLLLLGLGLLVNVAVSLITVPVALLNQELAQGLFSLLWLFSLGLGLWVALNATFTVQALALQDIGLVQAIWRSFNVVRRNLWATLGLILLSLVIQTGFAQIWQGLNTGSWQTLLGIIGNAYIGSGVMAAIMTFYLDRHERWRDEQRADVTGRSMV
jgi:hypothetical protein